MRKIDVVVFFLCFLVLEFVAFINSYYFNLKGATVDAERFVSYAIEWLDDGRWYFATNAEFFIQYIGTIFIFFGPSEFVATQFGLIALIIAGVYFVKLLRVLGYTTPWWALIAFFLWPSMLSRVTTTLREPYLILFLVLICFFAVRLKAKTKSSDVLGLVVVSAIGFMFHKAFSILSFASVAYVAFFVMRVRERWWRSRTFFLRLIVVAVGGCAIAVVLSLGGSVRGLGPLIATLSGDTEYVTRVLDWKSSREFRTTYSAVLDVSSPSAILLSGPKVLIYYLFSPFPWQVSNLLDLLAMIEAMFRLIGVFIIVYCAFLFSRFPKEIRPVFIIAFILILIWAAGTTNYGTASRHHITTNWVFLLAFVMWFQNWRRRPSMIKIRS